MSSSASEYAKRPAGGPVMGIAVLGAFTLIGAVVVHYEFSSILPVDVSPEPLRAVVVAPSPIKIPGKNPARVQDGDRVVRVSTSAESARAAAYTLAGLLKRAPIDAAAFEKTLAPSPDFVAAGKVLGLGGHFVEGREDSVRREGRPMILPLKEEPDVIETAQSLEKRLGGKTVASALAGGSAVRYVVLAKVHGSDAVILDPLAGRTVVPLRDLIKRVEGKGVAWVSLLPQ